MSKLSTQDLLHISQNSNLISCLGRSRHLKIIRISECEPDMNIKFPDALQYFPSHLEIDISGNRFTVPSRCADLIQKSAHLKCLRMQDCGIIIDTEIAEAISQLPEQANLDLSGNTVTKMDSSLLCHVIPVISNKKIDLSGLGLDINDKVEQALCSLNKEMEVDLSCNRVTNKYVLITLIHKVATIRSLILCNCGIQIDAEVAEAVSRLPDDTQLDLSGNRITGKSACITLLHKAATMKSLNIHDCISNCDIQIDTEIAEAVSRLPDHTELDLSGNQVTDKSACITLIHKAARMKFLNIGMKSLNISNYGIQIDAEIAEAVSRLPDDTELDLSGNQVTDKSTCITLIHKAATMKSLSICNCGIQIDTKIAKAVSRLPGHTQLDLSGNQVTDKSACITLIQKAATMKSLNIHNCMSNCGIQIDTEIAEAVSRLPDHTELDLSGNQVTDKSACITLIHKAARMKFLNIGMKSLNISNYGIQIDAEIAEAVSRLPDDTELDLSGNQVTDKSTCITSIHKAATMKSLSICNCGIQIDTKIAKAVSRLPGHTQLDLSGNQVTDKSACITLIQKAATMKSLSICNCGIQIDTEIAEAVSRLLDHTQLDLSGNQVTDKSACITLIHKAATMKSLSICNCGIQIDTEIAEAISRRLPDHTELDLSGNQVTDKSACITLIHKAASMKSLSICNCGIQIDTEIAEAISRLPDHTELDLSANQVTDKSACITLIHKAGSMKSLSLCNCDIKIDTEIAEAVSKLPDRTPLDLSGNDIRQHIDPHLFSRILVYMKKQEKINIDGLRIMVNVDIVSALSALSKLQTLIINRKSYSINALYNTLTARAAAHLPQMVSKMSQLQDLYINNCDINNEVLVALTDSLYKHCPLLVKLSLSGNHLSSGVWEVLKHIQHMKNLRELWLRGNPCVNDNHQKSKIEQTIQSSCPYLDVWL